MNAKLNGLTVLVAACLAGSAFAAADRVRVYTARPDVFEYVFASVVAGSDTATPQLSFNNLRTGRTTFAKVGENVGDYRVSSFTPKSVTFISERTGKEEVRKGGVAVLNGPTGQTLALEMGRPLANENFVAWLVDVENGSGIQVRAGDTATLGGVTQKVESVSLEQVRVNVDGQSKSLAMATEPERTALGALWARQREAWEESKRRADERARKEAEAREQEAMRAAFVASAIQGAQTYPPVVKPARTQISVVTEYRYPTEFEVIPPVYDSRGNMISPLVVVPRHFVTRPVGVTMDSGTPTPVLQDSRSGGGQTTSVSGPR